MSGFSIELLEEGYRAVDPVARLRFVVKRAAEDTPVSAIDPAILAGAVVLMGWALFLVSRPKLLEVRTRAQ